MSPNDVVYALLVTFSVMPVLFAAPASQPAQESQPKRHQMEVAPGKTVFYVVAEPAASTPIENRWMLVYLYGARGSAEHYNLSRPPYAKIRQALSERGAYVVVPDLGPLHFMNDEAKQSLTRVIEQAASQYQIDLKHVHLMGTSMGAGSALAYAINHPDRVRSVCAIMPMTDFAEWVRLNPKYAQPVSEAYGGSFQEKPEIYNANSALKHADALMKIPVLLIHGTADRTVPASLSEALAAKLKAQGSPCTLIEVEGVAHTDDIVTDLQDQIVRFLVNAND